jgi:hypothetical protein
MAISFDTIDNDGRTIALLTLTDTDIQVEIPTPDAVK